MDGFQTCPLKLTLINFHITAVQNTDITFCGLGKLHSTNATFIYVQLHYMDYCLLEGEILHQVGGGVKYRLQECMPGF